MARRCVEQSWPGERASWSPINASAAAAARELMERGPGAARSVVLDVADARSFQEAVGEVDAERGRLDLAFSNTGIGVGGPTEELSLEHWERMLDVNAGHRRR